MITLTDKYGKEFKISKSYAERALSLYNGKMWISVKGHLMEGFEFIKQAAPYVSEEIRLQYEAFLDD